MMNKLSAAQQREVLAELPGTLLKVAAERDFYRDAYLANASRQRIEKVASSMIEKGIKSGGIQEVADELEKSANAGDIDLAVTERAVELVGADMGKHAAVSDEFGSAGSSDFERFLVS
jgi:hypothetical protein